MRGESNAVQPQPAGRTAACTTLPKSERGPHAAPGPRCAAGRRGRGSSPGRGWGRSPPGPPFRSEVPRRAPRDPGRRGPGGGSRGGGEWASSRGRPAAAPSPTPSRKAHLPRRAPEAARGHGGAGRPGVRRGAGGGQRAGGRDARPHGRPQPLPGSLTPDAGRPGAGHSPSVRLHQAEGARTRRAALEGAGELAGVWPAPPSVPVRREQLSAPPPPARPRPLRAGPRAPGDRRRRRHRPGAFPTPPQCGARGRSGPGRE